MVDGIRCRHQRSISRASIDVPVPAPRTFMNNISRIIAGFVEVEAKLAMLKPK